MMNSIRVGAVLGVIAIGVVGFGLFGSGNESLTGGPALTARPSLPATPTATPAATPAPTSRAITPWPTLLEPGAHEVGSPFRVRVAFTVPGGWQGEIPGPNLAILEREGRSTGINFQLFDTVWADPCDFDRGALEPPVGQSVDDLVSALVAMPTIEVSRPSDVTLGGRDATSLVLTAPATSEGCTLDDEGRLRIWQLPLGATLSLAPGEQTRVWILDVEGERLVIDVPVNPGQNPDDVAEIQEILESLRFSAAE